MRILAVLHSPAASGGDTTIRRIAGHLAAAGHSVTFVPDGGPARGHDVLIGVHALFAGPVLHDSGLPYVLVFGGTDLNEFVHDPPSLAAMTKAVDGAAALVAFNSDFVERCLSRWPGTQPKLHLIPQGVRTDPDPSYALRARLGLPGDARVFLLPAGLRPIKDPLALVDTIQQWHRADPRIHLVIAGAAYDEDFAGIVLRRSRRAPGVRYAGAIAQRHLHAAMAQSTAVLNTSLSECSPNALLEAMWLRRPVLARDIPGNAGLIRHDDTGLLFAGPAEFRRQAQRLLDEPGLAARLGRRAGDHVRRAHTMPAERAAYERLFASLAAGERRA